MRVCVRVLVFNIHESIGNSFHLKDNNFIYFKSLVCPCRSLGLYHLQDKYRYKIFQDLSSLYHLPVQIMWGLGLVFTFLLRRVGGVLRFPDEYYDDRFPLHWTDCERSIDPVDADRKADCYQNLRRNMLEDLNCDAIVPERFGGPQRYVLHIPDKIALSTCPKFIELYKQIFDAAQNLKPGESVIQEFEEIKTVWESFLTALWGTLQFYRKPESGNQEMEIDGKALEVVIVRDPHSGSLAKVEAGPRYANSTTETVKWHLDRMVGSVSDIYNGILDLHQRLESFQQVYRTDRQTFLKMVTMKEQRSGCENEYSGADNSGGNKYSGAAAPWEHVAVTGAKEDDINHAYENESDTALELLGKVLSEGHEHMKMRMHTMADLIHKRVCFLLENLSMTVLVNFHIWQLAQAQSDEHRQMLPKLHDPDLWYIYLQFNEADLF